MKHLAVASITLFLIFGAYSATPVLNVSNATSTNSSHCPWLFAGAYENYTISGNTAYSGNTYRMTGFKNTTIIKFNSVYKSIEVNLKCLIVTNGQSNYRNSTCVYPVGSFSEAVNETILSDLNNGNLNFVNLSVNCVVTDSMKVELNTKFGNIQTDILYIKNDNGNRSIFIDSLNGVILQIISTNNSGGGVYAKTINSTNVLTTQHTKSSYSFSLSIDEIYEITEFAAIIVVIGAAFGYITKRTKK
jgi:hypothetical protein